ncbi:MAG: hypothetical protein RL728_1140 [Bacteroidota bacterium]|jgi:single-strand DNA-binding protein
MSSLNQMQIIGNVGNEPEVKVLDGGKVVAKFSVATSDNYKDKEGNLVERTDWHNITAWGKTAQFIEKYVKKGSKVFIQGKHKTESYDDKEGVKRYSSFCQLIEIKLLDKKEKVEANVVEPTSASVSSEESIEDLPF